MSEAMRPDTHDRTPDQMAIDTVTLSTLGHPDVSVQRSALRCVLRREWPVSPDIIEKVAELYLKNFNKNANKEADEQVRDLADLILSVQGL